MELKEISISSLVMNTFWLEAPILKLLPWLWRGRQTPKCVWALWSLPAPACLCFVMPLGLNQMSISFGPFSTHGDQSLEQEHYMASSHICFALSVWASMVITPKGSGRLDDKIWIVVSSLPNSISVNHKQITSIHSWQEEELYSAGRVSECTVVNNVDSFLRMQRCSQKQSWCRGQFTLPQKTGPRYGLFPAVSPWFCFLHHRQFLLPVYLSTLSLSNENCWRAHTKHTTPRERNKFSDGKH